MAYTRAQYLQRIRSAAGDSGWEVEAPAVSLSSASGGSLSAATYRVAVSAMGRHGETLPCDESTVAVGASGQIAVSIPKALEPVGYAVYAASATSGNLAYQGWKRNWPEATADTYSITSFSSTGAAPLSDEPTYGVFKAHDDYVDAAESALLEYSRYNPAHAQATYTLAAAASFALPNDWSSGFSNIERIEYPYDDDSGDNETMDPRDFYVDEVNSLFWFRDQTPTAGDTLRMSYTTPHALPAASATQSTLTVPDIHLRGLVAYAAEKIQLAYAGELADQGGSEVGMDYGNRGSSADEMRRLANANNAVWKANWGVDKSRATAQRAAWSFYRYRGARPY